MGIKVGNVIQAKTVAVAYTDDNTTLVAFNLPPNAQIVGVRCGGPVFFAETASLSVTSANAGTTETPVAIAAIDAETAIVTMDLDSSKLFARLGVAQTIRVVVSDITTPSAGNLAVVVEYM
jgi:hypothetical protein